MAKYYVNVRTDGTFWYKDREMQILHRLDGAAIECTNGDKRWYKDGKLHREDGPALIKAHGYSSWFKDGKRHRVGGPAQEYRCSTKCWWVDGQLHREDGPAVVYADGGVEYWLNNKQLSKEKWEAATQCVEELTVAEIEQLLGKRVKVVK